MLSIFYTEISSAPKELSLVNIKSEIFKSVFLFVQLFYNTPWSYYHYCSFTVLKPYYESFVMFGLIKINLDKTEKLKRKIYSLIRYANSINVAPYFIDAPRNFG